MNKEFKDRLEKLLELADKAHAMGPLFDESEMNLTETIKLLVESLLDAVEALEAADDCCNLSSEEFDEKYPRLMVSHGKYLIEAIARKTLRKIYERMGK